ncbi:MAG: transglutaminase domain-containing protein [Promethearchaeota archaeon]|nr:MAG: transglutaminase domain-containing protein [Candidatus Lokiarchaeota archaeon]
MNFKKHNLYYNTILAFFMISLCFGTTMLLISSSSNQSLKFPKSASNGVSHYDILQSVEYKVEMNYTVSKESFGLTRFYYKIPRIDNRTPYSTLTRYCPPYQESELLYNNKYSISGGSSISKSINLHDRFNNTYDAVNITMSRGDSLKLSQEYNVTLNQVSFSNISDSDIGTYDTSDIMFELYCNQSVQFFNTSDPDLISISNLIVDGGDNPVEKAYKIINWIGSNINYESQTEEKGASWAYDNSKGDCSEYADLMITLLRIQNIPARKIVGLIVSNDPTYRPSAGDELIYTFSNSEDTVMGHAWIEYYVPNIGWIACDPTWNGPYDYFNRIDYLRFGFTVGSWIRDGSGTLASEFPFPMGYSGTDYNFELKLTVLGTKLSPLPPSIWDLLILLIIIFAIVGVVGFTIYIIIKILRHRKKSTVNY